MNHRKAVVMSTPLVITLPPLLPSPKALVMFPQLMAVQHPAKEDTLQQLPADESSDITLNILPSLELTNSIVSVFKVADASFFCRQCQKTPSKIL